MDIRLRDRNSLLGRAGVSFFGRSSPHFFLRLEEWRDHIRSGRYQKCAGDRLAETQVTVSRAIHVLSTEDEPLQVVTHRDRACRNLENLNCLSFLEIWVLPDTRFFLGHTKEGRIEENPRGQ